MKRLVSIAISLAILLIIYWKIDFARLVTVFQNCDIGWLVTSLSMAAPLTWLTAWRLRQLMPAGASLSAGESNRLILAASTLNMVLPSKMGDVAKAYFMTERGGMTGSLALCLVVFEKACDMISLLLWCAFGLALYEEKGWAFWVMTAAVAGGLMGGLMMMWSAKFAGSIFGLARTLAPRKLVPKFERLGSAWRETQGYFRRDRALLIKVGVTSIFIWFLHLLQIWFFILALRAWTPFIINLALSPLAILAGLVPLTFAGVGTRDAALILFYKPFFDPATAAALGLLCTSRYLIPAIGGLPFLGQYLATARRLRDRPGG